jgi:hypothetical protein
MCRSRIAVWQIGLTLQYGVLDRMDSIAYVFLQCYGLWIVSGKDQIICGSLYFVMRAGCCCCVWCNLFTEFVVLVLKCQNVIADYVKLSFLFECQIVSLKVKVFFYWYFNVGEIWLHSSLPTGPSGSGVQWLWWWSLLPEAEILIVLVVAHFAFRKGGGAPMRLLINFITWMVAKILKCQSKK